MRKNRNIWLSILHVIVSYITTYTNGFWSIHIYSCNISSKICQRTAINRLIIKIVWLSNAIFHWRFIIGYQLCYCFSCYPWSWPLCWRATLVKRLTIKTSFIVIWRPLEANFASVLHSLYDAGVHTILYLGSTLLFF